jgi:hypothetical protein
MTRPKRWKPVATPEKKGYNRAGENPLILQLACEGGAVT